MPEFIFSMQTLTEWGLPDALAQKIINAVPDSGLNAANIPEHFLKALQAKSADQTVFSLAAQTLDDLKTILAILPEESRLEALKEKANIDSIVSSWQVARQSMSPKKRGELLQETSTMLHWAASDSVMLKEILLMLPESQRLDALIEPGPNTKKSALDLLILSGENPANLAKVLDACPARQLLAIAVEAGSQRNLIQSLILQNPRLLKSALDSLNPQERLNTLKKKSDCDLTLLQWIATRDSEFLIEILTELNLEQRLEVLNEKNSDGSSLLTLVRAPADLNELLAFYPPKQRAKALMTENSSVLPLWYSAAQTAAPFTINLESLPDNDRLELFKSKERCGRTPLHIMEFDTPDLLKKFLDLYPTQAECLAALKAREPKGNMALVNLIATHEQLRVVIGHLEEGTRLEALVEKRSTSSHETMLDWIVASGWLHHFDLLALLTPEERRKALNQTNDNRLNFLAYVQDATLLNKILADYYPQSEQLFQALTLKDKSGAALLHHAATAPESFIENLSLLERKQLLEVLNDKDSSGTVFHKINFDSNDALLTRFLALYPSRTDCLAALKTKDSSGEMMLCKLASTPGGLDSILGHCLPKEQLFSVLKEWYKDHTVFSELAKTPDYLEIILDNLPENQRYAALNEIHNVRTQDTMLHWAASDSQVLQKILKMLTQEELNEVLKQKNAAGLTFLAYVKEAQLLNEILTSYYSQPEQLYQVLNLDVMIGYDRVALLHRAAEEPGSFQNTLKLLPDPQRVEVLNNKDNLGQTVLHKAPAPELLNLYPSEQRLNALKVKDNPEQTLFYTLTRNPGNLELILKTLEPEHHIEAINIVDGERQENLITALNLKKEASSEKVKQTIDAILNCIQKHPELKNNKTLSLQVLENTYGLLAGTISPDAYQTKTRKVLSNPKQSMQILGTAMMALGILVAAAAVVVSMVTVPALPVSASIAAAGLGTGAALTLTGMRFFDKGNNPYRKPSALMKSLPGLLKEKNEDRSEQLSAELKT